VPGAIGATTGPAGLLRPPGGTGAGTGAARPDDTTTDAGAVGVTRTLRLPAPEALLAAYEHAFERAGIAAGPASAPAHRSTAHPSTPPPPAWPPATTPPSVEAVARALTTALARAPRDLPPPAGLTGPLWWATAARTLLGAAARVEGRVGTDLPRATPPATGGPRPAGLAAPRSLAPAARLDAGPAATRRDGAVRPRQAPLAEALLAAPAGTPAGGEARPLGWAALRSEVGAATSLRGAFRDGGAPGVPVGDPFQPAPRRATRPAPTDPGERPLLDRSLHTLATQGRADDAAPDWVRRADGIPRVNSVNGLFDALARARDTEEVVRVLFLRADGLRDAPAAVSAPIQEVLRELRHEVAAADPARPVEPRVATETLRPPRTRAPEQQVLSQAPVRSRRGDGATTVTRPTAAWRSAPVAGGREDRVTSLVRRLRDLIHLAEHARDEARRQVRMAEDTAEARAESGYGVGNRPSVGPDGNERVDIESLSREVLRVVSGELERRRERRTEDADESVWW
jgi:hypothetical protein